MLVDVIVVVQLKVMVAVFVSVFSISFGGCGSEYDNVYNGGVL